MRVALVDRDAADAFRHMTFPAFRRLLDFDPALPRCVAVGAWEGGRAAGLALGAIDPERPAAELASLFVEREHRGRGMGTQLLGRAEEELARLGVREVSGTYMTGSPSTAAIEAVLKKSGWDDPVTRMLVVRCSLESIGHAPWIKRYALPAGWEIVPWIDISHAEREEIRRTQEQAPWIPPDLVPFQHEAGLEPVTSLALRVHGKVLGWVINHVVEDVLRYTCSFVRRDLQRMGRILLLYNEAVARMPGVGLAVGMWTVPVEHEGMARFARRWMQPYSIFFGETRGTGKRLTAARAG